MGEEDIVRQAPNVRRMELLNARLALLARGALTVKEAEKQLILRALKETEGNRTLAAKKVGMSRRTLHRKLHLYHLEGF